MKASDLFIQCLENEGVKYIFGLPGEENEDIMMSLLKSKVQFVTVRHEQAAAFMADGYGRLTGEAGVCLGTLGPGATNLVTGVANANLDNAPVVAITGQGDTRRLHKESHQNIDVLSVFRPITKWNASIDHPCNIPEVVRKAFKIAEAEKPGATHIELREDIAKLDVETTPIPHLHTRRPGPDRKVIEQAVQLIEEAKHPIILIGNGAVRKNASKQIREFIEKTRIFAAHTFMGKGVVSYNDPYNLFTIGLQAKDYLACAFEYADLVITIGYDLVEYPPKLWNQNTQRNIIHIDFTPAEVDENYRVTVEVVSDISDAVRTLNELIDETKLKREENIYARFREQMYEDITKYRNDTTFPLKPQKILSDVREIMGTLDILMSDVGAHKMWIARNYQCYEPNTCLIPNGFCSMGGAMCWAIIAKMLYPERKILAISGDGGFLMNVQDLETAVRFKVPFVNLVWNDGKYALVEWKQLNHFGITSHTTFGNPDFVKLAESFNALGYRIDKAEKLKSVLLRAFEESKEKQCPAIIDCPVLFEENLKFTEQSKRIVCELPRNR